MNSLELENISKIDITKLSDDEILEVYKIIKEYLEKIEQEIQKVNADD